jgi:5-methylcytosine-specific restriction endonuclease McrA
MSVPGPEQQIEFLTNLQRLLQEGAFVATYKYAFLMALADISVEQGTDDDAALEIPTRLIGEKYAQYYWRQSMPYHNPRSLEAGGVLRQNTGKPAGVLSVLGEFRSHFDGSLAEAQKSGQDWEEVVSNVTEYARGDPLERLQNIGKLPVAFLYDVPNRRNVITLKAGVAYCFRKHYGLVVDLVRGAWVRHVRRFNLDLLGESADLQEFLFGSERDNLAPLVPVLNEIQEGTCFYCSGALKEQVAHVDHFIPWSRYPVDLGHNFVLAHASCNGKKSDRLACSAHLDRWVEQLERHTNALKSRFESDGIVCDLRSSLRIANWAYTQTFECRGLTWVRGDEMVPLQPEWNSALVRLLN